MRLRQDRDKDRLNRLMRSIINIQNNKKHARKMKELKLYVVEWNYPQENFDPKSPDRKYLVSHVVAD
ncbi:hypothetical protein D3C87_2075240 [compost metagenome]